VKSIQHIGKEANKLEEQFFTGFDPDAQLEYGISPEQKDEILKSVLQAITIYGAKSVATAAKLSARHVLDISKEKTNPSELVFIKLQSAVKILESVSASEQELRQKIKEMMEEKNISIRSIASKFEIDASNLAKVLSGLRSSKDQLIRMHANLMELADSKN
jgi:predicted transcriptional regulator